MLKNSLNEKNKALYDLLTSKGVEIIFNIDPNAESWQVEQVFKISSMNEEPNPAGMAHELLHVKLYSKGFSNDIWIYQFYNENNSSFSFEFIGQLNNNLAHFKMLDEFLEMGFSVDEFLQDTPKTYFLENIIFHTAKLILEYKTGSANVCEQTLEIIQLCAGAKLFELYRIKDPHTKNGLHSALVMDPLKEINKELVEGLDKLFSDWNEAYTLDNSQFFFRLNSFLKEINIPNYNDCKKKD